MEIKKLGGGGNVKSFISGLGKHYIEHLENTTGELVEQIKLISPTGII